MQLRTVKKNVKYLLENNREIRDDYVKLVLQYWVRFDKAPKDATLSDIYKFNLTSTESITRASRNLQKNWGHLRGKRYNKTKQIEEEYKQEFKHN